MRLDHLLSRNALAFQCSRLSVATGDRGQYCGTSSAAPAHQRRLLHRDVKPANILLTDPRAGDSRILLADFGIARDSTEINGLTATNVTVGSVVYAPPEQLMGKAIDGRADQYALYVPINRGHPCARRMMRAIPSTPCTAPQAQVNARCALGFMPQATALTESGWTTQPILST